MKTQAWENTPDASHSHKTRQEEDNIIFVILKYFVTLLPLFFGKGVWRRNATLHLQEKFSLYSTVCYHYHCTNYFPLTVFISSSFASFFSMVLSACCFLASYMRVPAASSIIARICVCSITNVNITLPILCTVSHVTNC